MPEPRLISSYLDVLAAELPASIVEELADGLTETHRSYLRQGLAPDLAARSAVAEFGEPELIVPASPGSIPQGAPPAGCSASARPTAPAGDQRRDPAGADGRADAEQPAGGATLAV